MFCHLTSLMLFIFMSKSLPALGATSTLIAIYSSELILRWIVFVVSDFSAAASYLILTTYLYFSNQHSRLCECVFVMILMSFSHAQRNLFPADAECYIKIKEMKALADPLVEQISGPTEEEVKET